MMEFFWSLIVTSRVVMVTRWLSVVFFSELVVYSRFSTISFRELMVYPRPMMVFSRVLMVFCCSEMIFFKELVFSSSSIRASFSWVFKFKFSYFRTPFSTFFYSIWLKLKRDLPLWIYLFVSVIKQKNVRFNIFSNFFMLKAACEITIDCYFLKG